MKRLTRRRKATGRGAWSTNLAFHRPSRLDQADGSPASTRTGSADDRCLLPQRQDRQALKVLVLGTSLIEAILLAVFRLDVTACVLAVDVDLALEHHPEGLGRNDGWRS